MTHNHSLATFNSVAFAVCSSSVTLGRLLVLSFASPAVSKCAHRCWIGTQPAACLCLGWGLPCHMFTGAQQSHWSFASDKRKVWLNSPEHLTCRWRRGLGVGQKQCPSPASPQKLAFQKIFLGWEDERTKTSFFAFFLMSGFFQEQIAGRHGKNMYRWGKGWNCLGERRKSLGSLFSWQKSLDHLRSSLFPQGFSQLHFLPIGRKLADLSLPGRKQKASLQLSDEIMVTGQRLFLQLHKNLSQKFLVPVVNQNCSAQSPFLSQPQNQDSSAPLEPHSCL